MDEDKDISELMQKAKESFEAAKSIYRDGFYHFSAGRSYHSISLAVRRASPSASKVSP